LSSRSARDDGWRGVLADVERVATPRGRDVVGCLALEGIRLHERALRAGHPIDRVVVGESLAADESPRARDLLRDLRATSCDVRHGPDEEVRRLMGGRGGGPIVGLAPLPVAPGGLLKDPDDETACLLVAVEVEDPGNVGALMRTALASGAAGLVAVGITDPFHPKAVRTSMGSVFKLPVHRQASAAEALQALRAAGLEVLAAVSEGGVPLPQLCRAKRAAALLVGSEAFGLDPGIAGAADRQVTVPMSSRVDSFSVNAAAAVLLYGLMQDF
jgi:TrmH family RNA methyltransferase